MNMHAKQTRKQSCENDKQNNTRSLPLLPSRILEMKVVFPQVTLLKNNLFLPANQTQNDAKHGA